MNDLVQINKKTKYTTFVDDNPFSNASKMLYHLDRVVEWQKTGKTFPVNMEINLIDVCNQACFSSQNINILTENGFLKLDNFKKFFYNPKVKNLYKNSVNVKDVINDAYYTGWLYKIKYETSFGILEIETTEDHKFFTQNIKQNEKEKQYFYPREVINLSIGDKIGFVNYEDDNDFKINAGQILDIEKRFVEDFKVYCLTIDEEDNGYLNTFIIDGGLISGNCRWCISSYSHVSNPSMTTEDKKSKLNIVNETFKAPNGRKIQQGLDIDYLKSFLTEAKEMGLKSVVYSGGGDSTLHKHFDEAVLFSKKLGLDIGIMTNGQFKKELIPIIGNNCEWIRFSLDTFSEKDYEYQKFTKGFQQVISNIKELVSYPVKIGLNMNIAEWNYKEIIDFAFKAKELGADYSQFRPVLKLNFDQKYNEPYRTNLEEDLLNKIETLLVAAEQLSDEKYKVMVSWDKFKDIRDIEGNFGRNYKSCEGCQFINVLGSDGFWSSCMYFLGNEKHQYGNIYEKTAKEIWNSKEKEKVDNYLRNDLDLNNCQISCRQSNTNRFLNFVKNPNKQMDINFI